MLEIKKAEAKDARIISLLGRVTFTETFGHLYRDKNDLLTYFERTFSVAKIENGLRKTNNVFWIAYLDKLPVGYAKLKLDSRSEFSRSENICQLQKIYVLQDFHSMKIGSELQNQLLSEAKERLFDEIWLSVLETNYKAINFYERNNFKIVGTHTFRIGKEIFDFAAMLRRLNVK